VKIENEDGKAQGRIYEWKGENQNHWEYEKIFQFWREN
jgi:hypothetical protein